LLAETGRAREAEEAFHLAFALGERLAAEYPDDYGLLNDLAWDLATHPIAQFRDPAKAVELARRAVENAPDPRDRSAFVNTLGVAYYRAGDWSAAVEALGKSMQHRKGGDSFDWFFLAMAHWQLGDRDQARTWYGRAVEWMDKNQPRNDELKRFRAEAALLGLAEVTDNVFVPP
jgi:tetratricopeptide (TPR) repeat protein